MNRQEFEERTGLKVTDAEYERIEDVYMAAGEMMDKDTFCRSWKVCSDEPLVKELAANSRSWEESCSEYADQIADMEEERQELARFLLGKSCVYHDTDFRTEAVRLVGESKVVAIKVQMGLPLWEEDKKTILHALK